MHKSSNRELLYKANGTTERKIAIVRTFLILQELNFSNDYKNFQKTHLPLVLNNASLLRHTFHRFTLLEFIDFRASILNIFSNIAVFGVTFFNANQIYPY